MLCLQINKKKEEVKVEKELRQMEDIILLLLIKENIPTGLLQT